MSSTKGNMADIVILGAGLTGLSAAYHLEKKGFFNYKIFEKEATPGGLCRSVQQDGFTFDYTGHLLHINDPYFRQFIETVIGFEHFTTIDRRAYIYSQGRYTEYPYQINLHGLPTETIIECIAGYIERNQSTRMPRSFEQWVLQTFGTGFAKHFFFPYQEKIFDYPVNKLSASWTGRFVPATSLTDMLRGALEPKTKNVGYNSQFFYPHTGGIYFWLEKLAQQLINPITTEHRVSKIDIKNNMVYFANGYSESYKQLITTLPLDVLLDLIKEPSNSQLKKARKNLLCNSVVNFNLGINNPDISDKHWIYYPEHQYPFYRVGFWHNFSAHMAPPGHSSLYGEFSALNKSQDSINDHLHASLTQVKKLFKLSPNDIVLEKIIQVPHAYVIYNAWRDKQLPTLLHTLENNNIYSIGRYGAWKYSSMQEGLLDGKAISDKLLIAPAQHADFAQHRAHANENKTHNIQR